MPAEGNDAQVKCVLGDPAAVYGWSDATLVGLVAAMVVGHAVRTLLSLAVGGMAASVVVAATHRNDRCRVTQGQGR